MFTGLLGKIAFSVRPLFFWEEGFLLSWYFILYL